MEVLAKISEVIKKNMEHIKVSRGIKEDLHLEDQKGSDVSEHRKSSLLRDSGEGEKDSDDEDAAKEKQENERQLIESVMRTVEAEEEKKSSSNAYDQEDIGKIHVELKEKPLEHLGVHDSVVQEDLRSW